jgi:hypothetical protein
MSPKYFDLKTQIEEVIQEIMKYKWLESEKAGRDIGMKEATIRWITEHYDKWFNETKEKFMKEI